MNENNHGSSRRRTANTSSSKKTGGGERRGTGTSSKNHSSHSSAGSGHYTSSSARRRKKKNDLDITQMMIYGVGAMIVILCIVLAVKGCGTMAGKGKDGAESSAISSSEESLTGGLTVDGVVITGMSKEEAKAAILKQYNWSMKVTYQDKETTVNNLMEKRVNEILEEVFASDKMDAYSVNTENMLEDAKAEAALISGGWSMVAKNGGISGYDKDTGKFTFTEGSNGVVIDQDKLAADIVTAIENHKYDTVLTAQTKEVVPDMTAAQLQEKYKTIGTYTTKTTSNSNRNENIRLSSIALNGTIVNPGQEFSFNNTTGARTEAKGYKPATAYLNGEIVQEPGGGVCQTSSTLYNAVVFAGLRSTERHAHSYEPSYVTPGEDAAVSYGGPDLKFVNNSDYPIAVKSSFSNQTLTISIYGIPILKDGEKVRMSSEKTSALDPPNPTYEEDQTIQPGVEKVVKEPTPGSRWTTYLVVYQNDKEVSRELFHNSSYRGKAAIIKRNTSGVMVTEPAATEVSTEAPVQETPAETSASSPGASGPGAVGGSGAGGGNSSPGATGPGTSGPGQEVQPTQAAPVTPGGADVTVPISPAGAQNPVSADGPVAPGQVGPGGA